MYIYNLTVNVEEKVHDEWLQWMQQEHIPAILGTGKFVKALMTRVLIEEEMGGITYSVQFTAESREQIKRYYQEDAKGMRESGSRFQGQYATFSTELEILGEY